MHAQDDLYTGPLGPNGFCLFPTAAENPTAQYGVGPLGRIVTHNITPLALGTTNLAALQASATGVPLVLAAGTGLTTALAPDGSGATVYVFDVPRCVSLTSASNLSAINYLITMYDTYGRKQTSLLTGPNANTVNTLKAAKSVLSIVPQGTSASTVSAGTSDIFGLPFKAVNAGYIINVKWASTLAANAGTFTAADATSPATSATGDPRGTFLQSGAASNGTNQLLIFQHVDASQCGPNATLVNAIGVTPA